ncbi:MAG: superoxide dismutase [Lachnospiraceae bacterium]|nr:superoxide dismutase [Lachnospiraceae bacterium]
MFEQIKLPYEVNGLEPIIDQLTIETHYGKHHAAYTKTFNELVEKAGLTGKTAEEILSNLDSVADETLRKGLRNQGGGYYNHNLYFEAFAPVDKAKHAPTGKLAEKINETFGSFDALKEKLSALATGQFGSGWAWLCTDAEGNLSVMNTPNQDNPYSLGCGVKPILALDVWEHAYYLQYKNLRAEYVKKYFDILDWAVVEKKYEA